MALLEEMLAYTGTRPNKQTSKKTMAKKKRNNKVIEKA
jgi:hypothetical protein